MPVAVLARASGLEDLMEELVGEIQDEYDRPLVGGGQDTEQSIHELDAGLHANDVAERVGVTLPPGRYETLGGFIMDRLGRIPRVGDVVEEGSHRSGFGRKGGPTGRPH